jgi:hypothetical protein
VNAQVHVAGQERALNFLRENSARANFLDRARSIDVTASRNFDQLNAVT